MVRQKKAIAHTPWKMQISFLKSLFWMIWDGVWDDAWDGLE